MENKSEWMEFYHRNLGLGQASGAPAQASLSGRVSDAMAVTTTMTMPDLASPQASGMVPARLSAASTNSGAAVNASPHLGAEGRVAKAPRKRTRVSKRVPTTLLNADTHNFRAMVQQFTGGPSAHLFTGGYQGAGSNLNFRYGSHHRQMNNPLGAAATVPLPQPGLQQEELVFFSSDDGGNGEGDAVAGGSNQVFLQGLTNSRPNHDGFLFDGASSIMQPSSTTFHRW